MALTFVLEGITVQHAAELLLDTEITRADRKACRYTYLRSLEDFTLALTVADVIATSNNLPAVGESYPGRDLLNLISHQLPDHIKWIDEDPTTSKPGDLLNDSKQRTLLEYWLVQLSDAVLLDSQAWQEHMLREFRAYAGSHPSLSQDLLNPAEYVFDKMFWPDQKLESAVPEIYVSKMLQATPTLTSAGTQFHDRARKAFIRRNVLAHIIIWQWYNEQRIMPKLPVREKNILSHVTRASIVSACRQRNSHPQHPEWRHLVPRLLAGIMDRCRNRGELLRTLLAFAPGPPPARSFRLKFEEAIDHFAAGKYSDLEQLRSDLEAWARQEPIQETISYNTLAGVQNMMPKIESGISISENRIPFHFETLDQQMRILTRSATRYAPLEAAADRLFPELR